MRTLTRSRLLLARHMTDYELRGLRLAGRTALAMQWQYRVWRVNPDELSHPDCRRRGGYGLRTALVLSMIPFS